MNKPMNLLHLLELEGAPEAPQATRELVAAKLSQVKDALNRVVTADGPDSPAVDLVRRASPRTRLRLIASPEVWDEVHRFSPGTVRSEAETRHAIDRALHTASQLMIAEREGGRTEASLVLRDGHPTFVSPFGDVVVTHIGCDWNITPTPKVGGTIALDFDSALARQHDPLSAAFSGPCLAWSDAEKLVAQRKLSAAMEYIDSAAPEAGLLIRNFLRRIFLRKTITPDGADGAVSGASVISTEHLTRYPGTIGITDPHIAQCTVLTLMEGILHETIHNVIDCYETRYGPITFNDASLKPTSPWSGNQIPNHTLTHAIFIYYSCYQLLRRCVERDVFHSVSERREAQRRMANIAIGFICVPDLTSIYLLENPLEGDLAGALQSMQSSVKKTMRYQSACEVAA